MVAARRRSHYIMHDEPNALRHVWMPYTQMKSAPSPVLVEETDGVYMILADGTRLIDGLASWWTACHGYNHPHIREAVKTQLGRMPHVMFGGIVHEGAIRLATRLAAILPDPKERSASRPGDFTRKRTAQIMDGAAPIRADGRAACFES